MIKTRFDTKIWTGSIYQITAACGIELHDTVRKQEILEIAGANLGTDQLLETSIPLIRYAIGQIPVAGDALGAVVDWGSDHLIRSLMFPLLEQAACKYYTIPSSILIYCSELIYKDSITLITPQLPHGRNG